MIRTAGRGPAKQDRVSKGTAAAAARPGGVEAYPISGKAIRSPVSLYQASSFLRRGPMRAPASWR